MLEKLGAPSSNNLINFYSRSSSVYYPRVLIESTEPNASPSYNPSVSVLPSSMPSLTPSYICSKSNVLEMVEDSFVLQGNADINYGTLTYVQVAQLTSTNAYKSVLKFKVNFDDDLSFKRFVLQLRYYTGTANGHTQGLKINRISLNSWIETSITWNSFDSTFASSSDIIASSDFVPIPNRDSSSY